MKEFVLMENWFKIKKLAKESLKNDYSRLFLI